MLYDSLNNKLKKLGDDVLMYPAHGPGSACGKNIGKETWSTIGQQKAQNYAMKITDRDEFIATVTSGLSAPPQYFFKDAMINKNGYENIDHVLERNVVGLDALQAKSAIEAGALVLDTRTAAEFENGFIPGSIFIGLDGTYAVWVGTLIDINTRLLVVASPGREREAILRLARVGYENVVGYLQGGVEAWTKAGLPADTMKSIDPEEFVAAMNQSTHDAVLDVRRPGEWDNGHAAGAEHVCLSQFSKPEKAAAQIDKDKPYYVHCAGGYRSVIAISILKQQGYTNLVNVRGGWRVLEGMDFPKEMPVPA
jgi:rhodanese-related sulfurtransferase